MGHGVTLEQYMTTIEVAKVLGISRVYAWRLASTKKVEAKKVGRQWFILPSSLRAYMDAKARVKGAKK